MDGIDGVRVYDEETCMNDMEKHIWFEHEDSLRELGRVHPQGDLTNTWSMLSYAIMLRVTQPGIPAISTSEWGTVDNHSTQTIVFAICNAPM
jgi:hypothetical protein